MTATLSDDELRFLKWCEPYIGSHPSKARGGWRSRDQVRTLSRVRNRLYERGLIAPMDGATMEYPLDGAIALTPLGLMIRTAELLRRRSVARREHAAGDDRQHADHRE